MESFNFIESAVVLSITKNDIEHLDITEGHFSIHNEAFQFVINYIDSAGDSPPQPLLLEKFPHLEETASGTSLSYSVPLLKKHYLYREAVDGIKEEIKTLKDDPETTIGNIISHLEELSFQHASNDVVVFDSGSLERLENYRKRGERRKKLKIIGLPTPLRTVNRTGVGIEPGNIMTVFARPTVGKSWFCLKQAAISVDHGYKTLIISPEMTEEEIGRRLDVIIGNMKGYSFSHYGLRKGDSIDEKAYKEFLTNYNKKNLLVCDHLKDGPVTWSGLRGLVRKHRPEVIVIDAAHLVRYDVPRAPSALWERISDLFYSMKAFATANKIVIIASVQANRGAADQFKPPTERDIALSDGVLQACDYIFSLCRIKEENNGRYVQIQKMREGEPPKKWVEFDWDVDKGLINERKEK